MPLHAAKRYDGARSARTLRDPAPPSNEFEQFTYDNFPLFELKGMGASKARRLAALSKHVRVVTVDVQAGDALLLPAYWYHEVDSFCDEDDAISAAESGSVPLNIAANYWWRSSAPVAIRHGILRERLRANARALFGSR